MHWTETFFTGLYRQVGLESKAVFGAVEAGQIKRALKLRKGERVLDLCCGIGRHAVPLAELGLEVTGLDITEAYLRRARAAARKAGVKVRFVKGDMRTLDYDSAFHAVINIFTSFGFYDDQTNQDVLRRVARALRPSGQFMIDVQNRDWLIKNYQPWAGGELGRDLVVINHEWDARTSRVHATWRMLSRGQARKMGWFSLRVYALHELAEMIEAAGMRVTQIYGSLELAPFEMYSRRLVLIARKDKAA